MFRSMAFLLLGMAYLSVVNLSVAEGRLVSQAVGLVGAQVVTSREVQINYVVEQVLYKGIRPNKEIQKLGFKSSRFPGEVTNVLLEWVVHFEAQSFSVATLTESEIKTAIANVNRKSQVLNSWKLLEVGRQELRDIVERKLRAKSFIRFKASSSVVPVTDVEAKIYYEKNRVKFGTEPFESFKSNIKTFLSKQQVDRRLKDWFEVLQRKYNVRNLISQS